MRVGSESLEMSERRTTEVRERKKEEMKKKKEMAVVAGGAPRGGFWEGLEEERNLRRF